MVCPYIETDSTARTAFAYLWALGDFGRRSTCVKTSGPSDWFAPLQSIAGDPRRLRMGSMTAVSGITAMI